MYGFNMVFSMWLLVVRLTTESTGIYKITGSVVVRPFLYILYQHISVTWNKIGNFIVKKKILMFLVSFTFIVVFLMILRARYVSMKGWNMDGKAVFPIELFPTVVTIIHKAAGKMNTFNVVSHVIFLRICFATKCADKKGSHFRVFFALSNILVEHISIQSWK